MLPIHRRPHSRRRPRPLNDRQEGGRERGEPEYVSFLTKEQILKRNLRSAPFGNYLLLQDRGSSVPEPWPVPKRLPNAVAPPLKYDTEWKENQAGHRLS